MEDVEEITACEIADEPEVEDTEIIVSGRDTWGALAERHGDDIAERNGFTPNSPLVAGTRLH